MSTYDEDERDTFTSPSGDAWQREAKRLRKQRDEARDEVERLREERDEARAELERLRVRLDGPDSEAARAAREPDPTRTFAARVAEADAEIATWDAATRYGAAKVYAPPCSADDEAIVDRASRSMYTAGT